MAQTTMDNPYSPSSQAILTLSNESFWSANLRCFVWFIPGTIIGLQLARGFQAGAENTLSTFQSMTVNSAVNSVVDSTVSLLPFACCCYLLTLLWRLPRRYLFGSTRVSPTAALTSGMLMPLLATLVVWAGVEQGWLPMLSWVHNGILVLSGFLAVECESILALSHGNGIASE